MTHLSIVIPVYQNEQSIKEVYGELENAFGNAGIQFEVIFVSDDSPDDSWGIISEIAENHSTVRGICLSRNFGQHCAITAGLEHCQAEWVAVMDCDLQDRPDELKRMYDMALEGYPIVLARRLRRKDGLVKRVLSNAFSKVFGYLTDTKQDPAIGNFGVYNRKVIDAILSMKDYIRFFPTMVQWVGFQRTYLDVRHDSRKHGESSYNISSLLRLAINSILSFSDKPLRIIVQLGLVISSTTFIFALLFLIKYLRNEIAVVGYTSLILSIWFLSGMIISLLGMVGIYIGKIFDQTKRRPVYIAAKKINIDDSNRKTRLG